MATPRAARADRLTRARTLVGVPPAPVALVVPMTRALRLAGLAPGVALPLSAASGGLVAGRAGAWGALLGLLVPAAFLGVTAATALLTARMDATRMAAVVAASWVAKVLVLIAVMSVLSGLPGWSRPAFAVSFALGVLGWLLVECLVVLRTRVPYVEPVPSARPDRL